MRKFIKQMIAEILSDKDNQWEMAGLNKEEKEAYVKNKIMDRFQAIADEAIEVYRKIKI